MITARHMMTNPPLLVPGMLVMKDGEPFLVESVHVRAVFQKIETFADKMHQTEPWTHSPVFHQVCYDVGTDGLAGITPLIPQQEQ